VKDQTIFCISLDWGLSCHRNRLPALIDEKFKLCLHVFLQQKKIVSSSKTIKSIVENMLALKRKEGSSQGALLTLLKQVIKILF
jgi:hypothetical protein